MVVLVAVLWAIERPLDFTPKSFWLSQSGSLYAPGGALGPGCCNSNMTLQLYAGLRWIAEHTSPDAVLAVSNQYQDGAKIDGRYFYYSAFAERRVMLEGENTGGGGAPYPSQSAAEADPAATPYPNRFRLNFAIFDHANVNALHEAEQKYGVRYLVADKLHGVTPEQLTALQRLGKVVFDNSAVEIISVE